MKGNQYNTKYMRSVANCNVDATGVTMTYDATYTDSKLGITNTKREEFRVVDPEDYLKLRVLLAPDDVRAKLYERAGQLAPTTVKVLGSKMGDQGGRLSWLFHPRVKAEFRALAFYVSRPVEPGELFQFLHGDHARDFSMLLEDQLGGKYEGLSDWTSQDDEVIEMQHKLFPVHFSVNENFKTREETAMEERTRAAQSASALDAVAATLKAKRIIKTS